MNLNENNQPSHTGLILTIAGIVITLVYFLRACILIPFALLVWLVRWSNEIGTIKQS